MKKRQKITLNKLPLNKEGYIYDINCNSNIKRRLLDLGLIKNSKIIPVLDSPSKNPRAYEIRGTIIAIRNEDSSSISVHY